jgi:hypothetical protein
MELLQHRHHRGMVGVDALSEDAQAGVVRIHLRAESVEAICGSGVLLWVARCVEDRAPDAALQLRVGMHARRSDHHDNGEIKGGGARWSGRERDRTCESVGSLSFEAALAHRWLEHAGRRSAAGSTSVVPGALFEAALSSPPFFAAWKLDIVVVIVFAIAESSLS